MRASVAIAAMVAVTIARAPLQARDRDPPRIKADVFVLPTDTQVYGPGRARPPATVAPTSSGPRTLRRAATVDDDEDDADAPGRRLRIDVALLVGFDSNPDEIDEAEPGETAAIEVAARGAIGGEAARLEAAVEGAVTETPQVPASQRYYVDAEAEGRVRIARGVDATATLAASRFALTQPTERSAAASAGLALDRGDVEATLRGGYEDRRYRDTDPSDDGDEEEPVDGAAAGEQPVRNVSDNALLRVLDYRRIGIDGAVEVGGDAPARPFATASVARIRFPTASEEIADRDALDATLTAALRADVIDGVTLSAGARYTRRTFQDPARAAVANLSPALGIEIDAGWLALDVGYRREFAQPELTASLVRDARIFELEAQFRPHRDWRLFVDASQENAIEVLGGARDTEVEITGRIEYRVAPRLRLLLEAHYDRYRYRETGEENFASDRMLIRTGMRSRF